jgi:UTP-glucose-1-phosphate uridylyltransferase
MKPTLLILAAGMGSRYGGLKQIDPVGPNGEIIIDYSIYDALRAGFGKLVFIIRHYFEDAFKDKIGGKFNGAVETAYAFQEMDAEIGDFKLPDGREKPWGTGHAILVAKDVIDEPFAVINADDYYGIDSFRVMADFLRGGRVSHAEYAMVGFKLRNTLSEYGSVARGPSNRPGDVRTARLPKETCLTSDVYFTGRFY